MDELKTVLPQFASLEDEEWLRAIAALEGEGKISGKFLRTGMASPIRAAAFMQITAQGQQSISSSGRESRQAQLDPRLKIPDRGEFDRDLPAYCQNANAEDPLSLIIVDIDHFKSVNDLWPRSG